MTNKGGTFHMRKARRNRAIAATLAAGALAAVAAVAVPAASSAAGSNPGLMTPGTLVVGMTLQFKPEMYLNGNKPAGYDVDILHLLAKQLGVKLQIDNLSFTGLIPGLQAKKFDMVSVGLSPTPAREQVISFTNDYVPYAQVLAVPAADASKITSTSQLNKPGDVITALLSSTAQQEAQMLFPKAKIDALADQESDFNLVATGRANAIVVEDYLLAQYQAVNPGKLAKVKLPPLDVQYGAYGVQKGNTPLISYLNKFLCTEQDNGTLAKLYKKDFNVPTFPGLPPCKP
jgi:ABC-type amino acid transport substrate-binding protein